MEARRSTLRFSGMISIMRKPRIAAAIATGDAGVAAGRLDQGVAGRDLAALLGMPDHRDRRPVFHRTCRVVAFELDQDLIAGCRAMRCSRSSGVLPTKDSIVGYFMRGSLLNRPGQNELVSPVRRGRLARLGPAKGSPSKFSNPFARTVFITGIF